MSEHAQADLIERYRQAAEAGATLLDVVRPGWVQAFADDVAAGLEMSDCSRCVLGYVFGAFGEAPDFLTVRAEIYGFDLDEDLVEVDSAGQSAHWTALQAGWLALITKRLADEGLLGR